MLSSPGSTEGLLTNKLCSERLKVLAVATRRHCRAHSILNVAVNDAERRKAAKKKFK